MDRPEEYLKRADQADADAKLARDPEIKRQFSELAVSWRALARQTVPRV